MKHRNLLLLLLVLVLLGIKVFSDKVNPLKQINLQPQTQAKTLDPLTIEAMRARQYPGSEIKIEEILEPAENYNQYIASYISDGLKIYGLLTIPKGNTPAGGWPAIIFNHGYIPPKDYRTTERYVAYVDEFAKNGYVVFKSDYRGNGNSEGQPEGSYYSPAYTVDVLNALSSIKKYPGVNPNKIGLWGHSMGGNITLRSLVISPDIKVAVIWGGVVGTYNDLTNNWQRRVTYSPPPNELVLRNRSRSTLIQKYGDLNKNPNFWHSIDPNYYLQDIQAPMQLDVGLADEEVPYQFSEGLNSRLQQAGKTVEYFTYEGADHNISGESFNTAMQNSLDFFDKYLKNTDIQVYTLGVEM